MPGHVPALRLRGTPSSPDRWTCPAATCGTPLILRDCMRSRRRLRLEAASTGLVDLSGSLLPTLLSAGRTGRTGRSGSRSCRFDDSHTAHARPCDRLVDL
ncbi:hypothetical protein ACRAWF_03650, partial [Streptomyces sp. L7]